MDKVMIENELVAGRTAPDAGRRISWGAIFAGAVVALVIQLMLSVLGIGIGASTINPLTEQNPAAGIGMGAGIWFAVSTLIALFAGGWVAGHLATVVLDSDRILHGFLVWGVTTLLTFYLLTTAIGGLIGGTANMLGRAALGINIDGSNVSSVVNSVESRADALSDQRRREVSDAAASGIATAGIWTFVYLLVGAGAAAFGGYLAAGMRLPQREPKRQIDVARVRTT